MNLENLEIVRELIAESDEIKAALEAVEDKSAENLEILILSKSAIAVGSGASTKIGILSRPGFMVKFIRFLSQRYADVGHQLEKL